MSFLHRHRGLTPYLLLAPGLLYLGIFFVVPLGFLVHQSLESGNFDVGYAFTWVSAFAGLSLKTIEAAQELLDSLVTNAPPRDREVEAAKARARAAERFQM